MNLLKWKILIPIVALSVIALLFLSYYFQSSIDTGLLLSIIPVASPFLFYALDYYQKARINIKLENPQFLEEKIDDKLSGYKLRVEVVNIGSKICFNSNVLFSIKSKQGKEVPVLLVGRTTPYNLFDEADDSTITTITTTEETFRQLKYLWFKLDNKSFDGIERQKELRKNDRYYIIFPVESTRGYSGDRIQGSSSEYDRYVKLTDDKVTVELEIKGEDTERTIYTKKKTFEIPVKKPTEKIAIIKS